MHDYIDCFLKCYSEHPGIRSEEQNSKHTCGVQYISDNHHSWNIEPSISRRISNPIYQFDTANFALPHHIQAFKRAREPASPNMLRMHFNPPIRQKLVRHGQKVLCIVETRVVGRDYRPVLFHLQLLTQQEVCHGVARLDIVARGRFR